MCLPPRDTDADGPAEAAGHQAGHRAGRLAGYPGAEYPSAENPAAGAARGPRDIPRWVRWTVLPLLVLVPLGYVIVSADQSHDGSATSVAEAAARRMTAEPPSSLQQRIYQVPIPQGATHVGCLETNSWDTDVLYAQFTTTAGGLDTFLAQVGTSRAALRPGRAAVTAAQATAAGWGFPAGRGWMSTALQQPGDKPDHAVAVDLTDADAPTVYVASTINFQHGFGGG